ncbi:GNAT family N-acetyltransferase [Clostridium estertheticum]|uniref:GNAT family N-acetyltransferase n=1 Tax=Clostridium estertheticum TaxID=238834 RepID=UPI001CF4BEC8|nr:GNAT family N-acetyltransferase [Clostridium estertheticum]MCB2309214.1 GNAT family N-acetyltransferase [Clostridium estertheticum]MCB2347578.1 GNAT family N-acetyltransferase [Clostridium estertheticum]MCB2352170.1 GNAT family N-acetyltransferase [Clostridium estertheticum]WAG48355.1 GNAT family N-acetyltransferase [Clostridium estertheticum]
MNDEIIIRAMNESESDLEQVLLLRRIVFNSIVSRTVINKEILINYLKRNPEVSSVACTLEGKIIGVLLCGHDGIRGFIYHIMVYNEYRIKGISKMMVNRSLSELKKVGINTGFTFTKSSTFDTEEFWNSIGWTVIPDKVYIENKK